MSHFTKKINGIDVKLSDMIQIGTTPNVTVVSSYGAKFPIGSADKEWSRPNNFGYKINGTDISQYFTAKYIDYSPSQGTNTFSGTVPNSANKLKVILIGGGSGGRGGGGGYSGSTTNSGQVIDAYYNGNWNRGDFNNAFIPTNNGNLNISFFQNGNTDYGPNYPGTVGNAGVPGQYNVHEVDISNFRNYNISIGTGSAGSAGSGGGVSNNSQAPSIGAEASSGNPTKITIGVSILSAAGGSNTVTTPSRSTDYPLISAGNAGNAGNAGYGMNQSGNQGGTGGDGFCRVYFLY